VYESWRKLSSEQQFELEAMMLREGWRVINGSELPSVFPDDFRIKLDSAIVMVEPTDTGGVYLVTNAIRPDFPPRALDQEPFGLIVHSTGAASYGVFVHHGTWEGRTEYPPTGFWDTVTSTGIGDYFLAVPPSGSMQGRMEDLPKGHREAFDAVTAIIRRRVNSGTNLV
jgi:hypothetical protein